MICSSSRLKEIIDRHTHTGEELHSVCFIQLLICECVSVTMSVLLSAALLVCACVCVSESCTCFPAHPQELFCSSSIVMRAEVTGEKILPGEINIDGMGEVQYDIKVLKVFKGSPERIKKIKHASTSEMCSMCGIRLDHGQYLLSAELVDVAKGCGIYRDMLNVRKPGTGELMNDEGMSITLCDLIMRWDSISLMQKNNIKYRYQKGCECKISSCTDQPCQPSSENECVFVEWSSSWSKFACIRNSNGSCSWYTGTAKNHTHTHTHA